MSQREVLTDRRLKALRPAETGTRYRVWDAIQPQLAVRVTDKGTKTFVVVKRLAGAKQPHVHVLGAYPGVTLQTARHTVPGILEALSKGKSPKEQQKEEARAAAKRRADTFATAVEQFIEWELGQELRTAHETASILRREFLGQERQRVGTASSGAGRKTRWKDGKHSIWRERPVLEIKRRDVIERLDQIKARGGKHAARHALGALRKLFRWAEEGERFGVEESPAARVRDKTLGITSKDLKRQRVLNDAELRDVWRAADVMRYPYGPLVQMLMLTGQRLNDIARARRNEIDLEKAKLTVPPERFKTDVAQVVPLTSKAMEIVEGLPKFERGYLFSTSAGVRPAGSQTRTKVNLDKLIREQRKKEGREPMPHWVLHDLRRTVRTRLGDLGVDAFIAERVIGHALPGLHGVYDQGTHSTQKREALEKWEALLLSIGEPRRAETRTFVPRRVRTQ